MALRTARVELGPVFGVVGASEELDPKVCDCCQTAAAVTDDGPVVVYRNRSDQELRDISAISPPRWPLERAAAGLRRRLEDRRLPGQRPGGRRPRP